MNQAIVAVLVAGLLPVICAGIAKWGAKNYDNHDPRAWMAKLEGRRARADAAQQNSFEAFPFFAVAVSLALHSGASASLVSIWAWAFVVLRVLYIYCYVSDRASMRSIAWTLGMAVVIRIYLLAM